jgi:hypothetical protein
MGKLVLTFALCFSPALAVAQTVYKCVGTNGSIVYSQQPCGKDATLIMGAKAPAKSSASDEDAAQPAAPKAPDKRRPDRNVQAISDAVDDTNCRRAAQRLFVAPSTAKIDEAEAEIRQRESRSWVSQNAAQVQSMAKMDEQEILTLRQTISFEQSRNDAMIAESNRRVSDALAECDKKKAEREKAATQ